MPYPIRIDNLSQKQAYLSGAEARKQGLPGLCPYKGKDLLPERCCWLNGYERGIENAYQARK